MKADKSRQSIKVRKNPEHSPVSPLISEQSQALRNPFQRTPKAEEEASSLEVPRKRRNIHANIHGLGVETAAKRTTVLIPILKFLGAEHLAVARTNPLEQVSFWCAVQEFREIKRPHAHSAQFELHSTLIIHLPFPRQHLFLSPFFMCRSFLSYHACDRESDIRIAVLEDISFFAGYTTARLLRRIQQRFVEHRCNSLCFPR